MVATTTSTDGQVDDLTDTDAGTLVEESPGEWRWHCGVCPGRSIGTYPTFLAVSEGLDRHHEAAGRLHA